LNDLCPSIGPVERSLTEYIENKHCAKFEILRLINISLKINQTKERNVQFFTGDIGGEADEREIFQLVNDHRQLDTHSK
jgi:hypothetical protein